MNPTISLLCLVSASNIDKLQPEKLKKAYAKLNKYLRTHVDRDDAHVNMQALMELLQKKSRKTWFGSSSLIEPLTFLVRMTQIPYTPHLCNGEEGLQIMEMSDKGLASEKRLHEPNYPLDRMDRLLEHYAYMNARSCWLSNRRPHLEYAFKQLVYDHIEEELNARTHSFDIEENMAAAEELLKSLKFKNTALADALKLLLELKSVLLEDACDESGLKTILKNDLATKGKGHNWMVEPKRKVDKIVFHYSVEHANLCRLKLRKRIRPALEKLDVQTFRRVLSLTISYFLNSNLYVAMIEEVNTKSVRDDFTSTHMTEFVKKVKEFSYEYGRLSDITIMNSANLFDYLKAVSRGDPDSKYLGAIIDANDGSRFVEKDKVKDVVERYLLKPCHSYIAHMGREIITLDEYHSRVIKHYLFSTKGSFLDEIDYHMARVAFQACKFVTSKIESITQDIALISRIW